MQLGFTHGDLYRVMDVYSREAFEIYRTAGAQIIEVCVNQPQDVEKLTSITEHVKAFSRRSVHMPCHMTYRNDVATRSVLDRVAAFYHEIGAELAVVHPDLIEDASVFDDYAFAWAAENMDNRKSRFRDVADLREFFEQHPSWGMVLDVNHCFSNDPTMRLAADFVEALGPRIRQLHVSGYAGYHEPLFETRQQEILDACTLVRVPMIIESVLNAPEDARKEFDYIQSALASRFLLRAK